MHCAVNLIPGTIEQTLAPFGGMPLTFVVVDILRASTTICTALQNGAKDVIPFGDVEGARAAKAADPSALLCGERGGKKLEGFDLGNSPAEYTSDVVGGKSLLFSSTNGSVALAAAPSDAEVLVGGFVNATVVAQRIAELKRATVITCSGKMGQFALEDAAGAGVIIAKLWECVPDLELVNDGALAAQTLYDRYKSDPAMALWQSRHGTYLIEIGFGSDLSLCAAVDSVPVVPVMEDGRITLGT
jgi:2-phosphosulfolactate phosphatase